MRADFAFMQMMVIYICDIDLGSVIFQSVFAFDTQTQLLEWGVMAIEHDGTMPDSFNKLTYNSYYIVSMCKRHEIKFHSIHHLCDGMYVRIQACVNA